MDRSLRIVTACVGMAVLGALSGAALGHPAPHASLGLAVSAAAPGHSGAPVSRGAAYDDPLTLPSAGPAGAAMFELTAGTGAGNAPPAVPLTALNAYQLAAAAAPVRCHLDAELLAAIAHVVAGGRPHQEFDLGHRVTPPAFGPRPGTQQPHAVPDTDAGRWDLDRESDRRVGPMALLPQDWRVSAVDLDLDGLRDPQDVYDAAGAAMVLLCAQDRDLADVDALRAALSQYDPAAEFGRDAMSAYHRYLTFGMLPEAEQVGPTFLAVPLLNGGAPLAAEPKPGVRTPAPMAAGPFPSTPPKASTLAPPPPSPISPAGSPPSTTGAASPPTATATPALPPSSQDPSPSPICPAPVPTPTATEATSSPAPTPTEVAPTPSPTPLEVAPTPSPSPTPSPTTC